MSTPNNQSAQPNETRKKRPSNRKKRRQELSLQLPVPTEEPLVIAPSSVFVPYKRPEGLSKHDSSKSLLTLEVIGNTNQKIRSQNVLKSLTVEIIQKYKLCSSDFKYTNPKLVLTKPSTPNENNGKDNIDGNLILSVDDMLNDRYCVKDVLGCGTFGQVARCEDTKDGGKNIAVKIIKNKRAYLKQAEVETSMLELLAKYDPEDKHHIIRMHGYFYYENHLCIVTELLSINLFDLIKQNRFRGLTCTVISVFLSQILDALVVLADAHVIHCDLKPENILLTNLQSSKNLIKLIDFGSACFENETVYSYIQSRFYRSPEVLFGLEYNMAIDMWSLGCICAELFLGLPLFPGVSQYNQVCRVIEMLGMPPDHLIENGKFSHKYFKRQANQSNSSYELKSEEEYCRENNTEPKEWKRYFNFTLLDDLIKHYSMKNLTPDTRQQEERSRIALIDLLKGLLQWDPNLRWTARQAKQHPFVTGQPFTGPFTPEPDPSKVPMALRRHGTHPAPQPQYQYNPHLQYFTPPYNSGGYMPSPMASSGFIGPNLGPSPNTAFFQPGMGQVDTSSNTPGGIPIQGNSYQQPMLMSSPGSYGQWNLMPHMYGTPSAHGTSPYMQPSHHSRRGSGGSHLAPNTISSPNEDFQNLSIGRGRKDSYKKNGYNNSQPQQSGQRRQSFKQNFQNSGTEPQSSPQTLKPPKHPTRKGNSYGSYNKGRQYMPQEPVEKQVSPNIADEITGDQDADLFEFDEEQEPQVPTQLRKQPQHPGNNPYYNTPPQTQRRKGSTTQRPRGNSQISEFTLYSGMSGPDMYGQSPGNTAMGLLGSSYSSSGMSVPSSVNSAYIPPSPQQQQQQYMKNYQYGQSPQNAGSLLSSSFNEKKKQEGRYKGK